MKTVPGKSVRLNLGGLNSSTGASQNPPPAPPKVNYKITIRNAGQQQQQQPQQQHQQANGSITGILPQQQQQSQLHSQPQSQGEVKDLLDQCAQLPPGPVTLRAPRSVPQPTEATAPALHDLYSRQQPPAHVSHDLASRLLLEIDAVHGEIVGALADVRAQLQSMQGNPNMPWPGVERLNWRDTDSSGYGGGSSVSRSGSEVLPSRTASSTDVSAPRQRRAATQRKRSYRDWSDNESEDDEDDIQRSKKRGRLSSGGGASAGTNAGGNGPATSGHLSGGTKGTKSGPPVYLSAGSSAISASVLEKLARNPPVPKKQTHPFWDDMEHYFRPFVQTDMEFLKKTVLTNHDPLFQVPELGQMKPSTLQLIEQGMALRRQDSEAAAARAAVSSGRRGGGDDSIGDGGFLPSRRSTTAQRTQAAQASDLLGKLSGTRQRELATQQQQELEMNLRQQAADGIEVGDLTQRLLAALLDEDVKPASSVSSDMRRRRADAQATEATQLARAIPVAPPGAGVPPHVPVANEFSRSAATDLEERLKLELRCLGLFSETEAAALSADQQQDDEICSELRLLLRQLKQQIDANNSTRSHLTTLVMSAIGRQESESRQHAEWAAVEKKYKAVKAKEDKKAQKRRKD